VGRYALRKLLNFIAVLQNWLVCYVCIRCGGSLSYWYLVCALLHCFCGFQMRQRGLLSPVLFAIYIYMVHYGRFDSKIKIIWLWLLSVWCLFWLPNVCLWHIIVSSCCVGWRCVI